MFYIQFLKHFIEKMSEWLISSILVSNVSELLRSLTKNERLRQVAQRKWAIMSESLSSLTKNERIAQVAHQKWANEWIAHFFEQIAHSLIFGQKTSNSLGNPMSEFPALLMRYQWYSFALAIVRVWWLKSPHQIQL